MNKKLLGASLLLSILFTSACTSRIDHMREQGFSELYIQGFEAGCTSGISSAKGLSSTIAKDLSLFRQENDYQNAWQAAFKKCQFEQEQLQNQRHLKKNIDELRKKKIRSTGNATKGI